MAVGQFSLSHCPYHHQINGYNQERSVIKKIMELQTLQERVQFIENKRTWLRQLLADPQHAHLAVDINQALIELEDLATEFARTFPNGVPANQ
jgi:hypothetical protein